MTLNQCDLLLQCCAALFFNIKDNAAYVDFLLALHRFNKVYRLLIHLKILSDRSIFKLSISDPFNSIDVVSGKNVALTE